MSKAAAKRSKPTSTPKTAASQIPTPFVKAPSTLQPLLDRLDPAQVYITHIDRLPAPHKQQIFLIPVVLNGTIALLLLWRLYSALPTYWAIIQTLLGYTSSATVDVENTTRKEQIWVLLRRVGMFLFDFLLFRFVGPWPLTFFGERPANPVLWRWKLGFLPEEVVVRVSRGWGAEDLMKGVKQGEENAFFKTRILPSIDGVVLRRKTGYLLMDKSWDLEFEVMLDAHALLKKGDIASVKVLDKYVLVFMDGVGWIAWQWETDVDVIEDRRKKVVMFKELLTKLGKESLFFKWMEIVEEERDTDGGFTAAGQQKVAERVQREFEKEGVDFEDLAKGVGGLEELPVEKEV